MHRVTYVERPALMGIGQDLRTADDLEQATQEVFNYFDALEQNTDALSADIGGLRSQLTQIEGKLNELSEANRSRQEAAPPAGSGNGSGGASDGATIDLRDGAGVAAGGGPNGQLDVNAATAGELETVDGIGPATAAAIVKLRAELGGFTYSIS